MGDILPVNFVDGTPMPSSSYVVPANKLGLLRKAAQGYAYLFKANPYHDQRGRFADKDSPETHHFVSVGDRFKTSNNKDRKEFGAAQVGKAMFSMSRSERQAHLSTLSDTDRKAAHAALGNHLIKLGDELDELPHVQRQERLDAMTEGQRIDVHNVVSWNRRNKWEQAKQKHEDQERVQQEIKETAKRIEAARVQREIQEATVDNLPEKAKKVYKEMDDLRKRGMYSAGVGDRAKHAAALNLHYPDVSPARIVDALMGENARIGSGTIHLKPNGDLSVRADEGSTVYGAKIETLSREFDKEKGVVEHSYLRILKEDRGMGAVKKHFAKAIPLYHDMGMKEVKVHGALEGGFHTWARYGFNDDNPPAWQTQALERADRALKRIPEHLHTPEVKKELGQLDELSRKYGHTKEFPRLYTAAQTPHLDEAWAKSGNGSSGAKSKFKFDALAYGNWYGNIKFSDRDQMQHLADYVEANMPHHRADGSTEWVKPRKRA